MLRKSWNFSGGPGHTWWRLIRWSLTFRKRLDQPTVILGHMAKHRPQGKLVRQRFSRWKQNGNRWQRTSCIVCSVKQSPIWDDPAILCKCTTHFAYVRNFGGKVHRKQMEILMHPESTSMLQINSPLGASAHKKKTQLATGMSYITFFILFLNGIIHDKSMIIHLYWGGLTWSQKWECLFCRGSFNTSRHGHPWRLGDVPGVFPWLNGIVMD